MIPLSRPSLDAADLDAVSDVLRSGMLVMGANVAAFERHVAERVGRRHAIAVANGTAALALALSSLGIGPGDEVIVPALTWPSPAHAVRLLGATVVLVDVDPREWNLRGEAVQAARTPRTRAVIAIDQFGNPVRDAEIAAAADGLHLVEDAACAIGSRFPARAAGTLGVASCLSFHPRKVLTTGEGGMVLTDDDELSARLRRARNHGQSAPGVFEEPGGNHRMTEIAAALGLGQLARLDAIVAARRALAAHYRARLAVRDDLGLQHEAEGAASNAQTFGVVLPEGVDKAALVARLRGEGIEIGALSYALSRLPSLRASRTPCPITEAIVERGIALPLFPALTEEAQDRVVSSFLSAIGSAP